MMHPLRITADNPAGTDGFEFVEFAHPEPEKLDRIVHPMGYIAVRGTDEGYLALSPGTINYVLNREPGSHAMRFVAEHGPCAPAMAWRVVDAGHALSTPRRWAQRTKASDKSLDVPAVIGIGGSLLYLWRPMARRVRPMSANSTGSARPIRNRAASASTISTT